VGISLHKVRMDNKKNNQNEKEWRFGGNTQNEEDEEDEKDVSGYKFGDNKKNNENEKEWRFGGNPQNEEDEEDESGYKFGHMV